MHLPVDLRATKRGVSITFSGALDAASVRAAKSFAVKMWDLKRTRNYGSKHYNERSIDVAAARLGDDGRTVHLELPDIAPTWSMEIKYELRSAAGQAFRGTVHNTIHALR